MYYVYDGSFDGFLCCLHAHYYRENAQGIRSRQVQEQFMLFQELWMETDYTVSHRVFDGIRRKLGQEICEKAFQAFFIGQAG